MKNEYILNKERIKKIIRISLFMGLGYFIMGYLKTRKLGLINTLQMISGVMLAGIYYYSIKYMMTRK